ncbi:hypothetical protein KIN20_028505 [Parelaphostrongylus tenuis]|uniref:Protein SHQ1 homolog n=1 Tax=Parelaphostrongylus tenuis TaxID=148309 RepID=A0AAD5WEV7_PARTN|nr:hypothetical protein KIN20_028505 [Parelaphostrongylus tenuis]
MKTIVSTFIEQKITDIRSGSSEDCVDSCGYGFAWRRKGILGHLSKEIGDLVELSDPEHSLISGRYSECAKHDIQSFDAERYLLDFLDPEESLQHSIGEKFDLKLDVNADDRKRLKDFPKKKLPTLSKEEHYRVALSLIDLWESVKQAVIACVRRSLCYPLYRNWDLSMKVLMDTKTIVQEGRSALLHVLSTIHGIFIDSGEFRYLFNDLFVTDYCIWIQFVEEEILETLQNELAVVEVFKSDLGLDLEELELEGKMAALEVKQNVELDSDDEPE